MPAIRPNLATESHGNHPNAANAATLLKDVIPTLPHHINLGGFQTNSTNFGLVGFWGLIFNDILFNHWFPKVRTHILIDFALVDGRFHFPKHRNTSIFMFRGISKCRNWASTPLILTPIILAHCRFLRFHFSNKAQHNFNKHLNKYLKSPNTSKILIYSNQRICES